jgi:hypothetical protein
LVERYRTDPRSPYPALRYRTRANYDVLIKRIIADYGYRKLSDLKQPDLEHMHADWRKTGKVVMAKSLMTTLRLLFNFGATKLEDDQCVRLSVLMRHVHLGIEKPRTERLTVEHVEAIIREAHRINRPSIALAQSFQFDCRLRQRDVIGEWVPQREPGVSAIIDGDKKWIRGIQWKDINKDLVLHHVTSMENKRVELHLSDALHVVNELAAMGPLPQSGPVIVDEKTGVPYEASVFRYWWRKVADKAGVPSKVRNMDSRANERRRDLDDADPSEATA